MHENAPTFPPISEASSPPPNTIPPPEYFANRYGGLRAGRERAAAEIGALALPLEVPPGPTADPYGVEAAVDSGDIQKLHRAIGELLVDVGQKIEDEELITDAETIFHVSPQQIAAAEYARSRAVAEAEEEDKDESEGRNRALVISLAQRRKQKHEKLEEEQAA